MPLPGTTQGITTPQYGGVPTVPSPEESLAQSLYGTQQNLGGLYGLAGQTNQFNAAQAAGQYQANLPLYGPMTQQASSDIYSNLQGQLPADVIQQMQQRAAERGVQTGTAGSPNQDAAYLRAIGLTSLDLENLGQQQLSQAVARTPTGPLFDPSKFYITPADQSQAQLLANIYAAAPNPTLAAENALRLAQQGLRAGQGAGSGGVGGANFLGGGAGTTPSGPAFTPTGANVTVPGTGPSPGAGAQTGYPAPTPSAYSSWQSWFNSLPGMGAQQPTAPAGGGASPFYPSLGQDFQAGMQLPPDYTGPTVEDLFPGFTTPDQSVPPDWQAGVALPPDTGYTAPQTTTPDWQVGMQLPPETTTTPPDTFSGFMPDQTDWSALFNDYEMSP